MPEVHGVEYSKKFVTFVPSVEIMQYSLFHKFGNFLIGSLEEVKLKVIIDSSTYLHFVIF